VDVTSISSGFFNESITLLKFKVPKRVATVFFIILLAKIVMSIIIYLAGIRSSGTFWMDANRVFGWEQNKVFLENVKKTPTWAYLFVGWDSAWYLNIMTRGYTFSPQSYAFSPGLPIFGKLFSLLFQNPIVSIALCTLLFGVLWIPFYQLMAESYMSKRAALASALLFALSPYIFFFTSVAYSEGLFLFFTLSSWYLFKKGKLAYASTLASAASLTRMMGVVLVLPMLIGSLKQKSLHRLKNVILSCLPIVSLLFWLAYSQFTSNDWLAFVHTTEWSSLYSLRSLVFEGLPQKGVQAILEVPYQLSPLHWLSPVAIIGAIVVPPYLIYETAKLEKTLAIYSLVFYIGVMTFGALISTPRYISVMFPLWMALTAKLPQNRRTIALVSVVLIVFVAVSFDLWVSFLNGQFIG
jgi:hypothetical protein